MFVRTLHEIDNEHSMVSQLGLHVQYITIIYDQLKGKV